MSDQVKVSDGLSNVAANLGTARDKAAYSTYVFTQLSPHDLLTAYRSAWLPKAIVDIPAQDATRKWRAWNAEPDQIAAIEKVEKRLRLSLVVKDALIAARLFGGAAIYFGTNDKAVNKPLDPSKVRDIKTLTVLTPLQITPTEAVKDIESPYYGKPEFYRLNTNDKGDLTYIHASRLIVLEGARVPDVSTYHNQWGDSILQSVMDAVLQFDSVNANVNSLVYEAKVDVIRFKGFMDLLGLPGGDELVTKRLSAQALLKGINGALVLDMEDDYDTKNASFGGLPDIMDRFRLVVCGASKIAETRLFGRASAGLSGTGDGDERVYFDRVGHEQSTVIEPAMGIFDECLIWTALGSRPEEIHYNWRPLRQITETERANIFKTTADAARALAGQASGELIPIDALSDSLVNELAEQGVLPGLEAKVEEYGSLAETREQGEDTQTEAETTEPPVIDARMKDAAPRTLYVRRDVINRADIVRWAKSQGFADIVDDLHVTITYSRQPVDWFKMGESWSPKLEIGEGGPRQMDSFGDDGSYKVLLITGNELVWRHDDMVRNGASWDRDEYQPHITIQIGGDIDLSAVTPYQGKIILGPEIFEELRDD